MSAYYNDNDPYAAEFLRNLIRFGAIAPGDVDERSIEDVHPDDLRAYTQCHFFAGVGIWSAALRKGGWDDTRPVWTGSCPCQPFSPAGKGKGTADERHLWPAWFHLIVECRPDSLFGEQVASKDGLAWLDLVQADLEGAGYACGFGDTCAAGFGAPHIRQRLYFHSYDLGSSAGWLEHAPGHGWLGGWAEPVGRSAAGRRGIVGLADDDEQRPQGRGERRDGSDQRAARSDGMADRLEQPNSARQQQQQGGGGPETPRHGRAAEPAGSLVGMAEPNGRDPGPVNGHWRDADWLFCRDGKWRPVEPGLKPLAHGVAGRVGKLRAYGNGIVLPQAASVVSAAITAQQHFRLGIFA